MKKGIRIIITIVCVAVIAISWVAALRSKTTAEKQLLLIRQANELTESEIYISAVPLLEEAAGYDALYTAAAEEELKKVYLELIDKRGFGRRYASLLEKQMARPDAPAEVFAEAAEYHLGINSSPTAFAILRKGIEKTGDTRLLDLYESARYDFEINRSVFDAVTAICDQNIQVQMDGKWGIASVDGTLIIPCQYEKISTLHQNRAIVKKDGIIFAVDSDNNRIAVASDEAQDFRNFSENRTALLLSDGWRRATGDFEIGENVFEDIGMYSGGYAAAKTEGRWGVINIGKEWLIEAQYDEIIQDELGRCYGQGAVFVKSGELVYLYSNGTLQQTTYQDARPFSDEGFAAAKQNGKWGFIDTSGKAMIDFVYDDALSFSGHLAAVKTGGLWGYVNVYGKLVIEAAFRDAKSFEGGSAPVVIKNGWQLITLTEYKKERTLI